VQLAFILFKYFPFGGLQRNFLRIAQACQQRGHDIRVYALSWQGEIPPGFDVILVPAKAMSNHRRYERFATLVQNDLASRPADRVIGFNKMPGLDVYYAADPCYLNVSISIPENVTQYNRFRNGRGDAVVIFVSQESSKTMELSAAK